jgi:hypothetical protein
LLGTARLCTSTRAMQCTTSRRSSRESSSSLSSSLSTTTIRFTTTIRGTIAWNLERFSFCFYCVFVYFIPCSVCLPETRLYFTVFPSLSLFLSDSHSLSRFREPETTRFKPRKLRNKHLTLARVFLDCHVDHGLINGTFVGALCREVSYRHFPVDTVCEWTEGRGQRGEEESV